MTAPAMHGGLRLASNKKRSTQSALRMTTTPSQVVLPLDQHAGNPATPIVRVGERVLRGQPIAQPQGEISAWLHASIAGQVSAIESRPSPHRQQPALCIVIDSDGSDESAVHEPVDIERMDAAALCEHIAAGGIVGLGGAVFPTAPKLLLARQADSVHLILNGAECEPWISCDDMLMRERAADILRGAGILCHALQAARCTIVIEDDKPEAISAMQAAQSTAHANIDVHVVPTIYPTGGENQLVTAVTGVEVPSGGLPSDIGAICHNVGTAAAVARWIDHGEPLIRRIVTVTGSGIAEPTNIDVALGTPIAAVIAECGGYAGSVARLLMGGSMMGQALASDELPVVKGSNCLVVATPHDLQPRGNEMPCIRCGNCEEACPAMLLPQQLHWFALAKDLPALDAHGLLDCIECGCCDHVCPSQIPLTQQFRDAKPALVARRSAQTAAALARDRFEARDARLARLENERQAKLAERRKSAGVRRDT